MTNHVRQFNFIFLLIHYINACVQLYITAVNILLISSSFSYISFAAISTKILISTSLIWSPDPVNSVNSHGNGWKCHYVRVTTSLLKLDKG